VSEEGRGEWGNFRVWGRESNCETDRLTEERVSERENDGEEEEKKKKERARERKRGLRGMREKNEGEEKKRGVCAG
jgi:hypothetical protein